MYELVLKNVKHPSKRTKIKLASFVKSFREITKLKYKSFISSLSYFMGMFYFIENDVLKCNRKEILFCRHDDIVTHKTLEFRFKKILWCVPCTTSNNAFWTRYKLILTHFFDMNYLQYIYGQRITSYRVKNLRQFTLRSKWREYCAGFFHFW